MHETEKNTLLFTFYYIILFIQANLLLWWPLYFFPLWIKVGMSIILTIVLLFLLLENFENSSKYGNAGTIRGVIALMTIIFTMANVGIWQCLSNSFPLWEKMLFTTGTGWVLVCVTIWWVGPLQYYNSITPLMVWSLTLWIFTAILSIIWCSFSQYPFVIKIFFTAISSFLATEYALGIKLWDEYGEFGVLKCFLWTWYPIFVFTIFLFWLGPLSFPEQQDKFKYFSWAILFSFVPPICGYICGRRCGRHCYAHTSPGNRKSIISSMKKHSWSYFFTYVWLRRFQFIHQ